MFCISRLNSSSWVHGCLSNLIRPSVPSGSYHENRLILEYTRKDWLPISTDDVQTTAIKMVAPSDPSVVSSNVPHPTRDLMVVTIGEDMVFDMTVHIPVSTNANFTVNIGSIGLEGIGGHITQVGRNIKSLHRLIKGARKCEINQIIICYHCLIMPSRMKLL